MAEDYNIISEMCQVRHGSVEAFETMWNNEAPKLLGLIRKRYPELDPEVVLQETALRIWEHREKFKPLENEYQTRGWVITILVNYVKDELRKSKVRSFGRLMTSFDFHNGHYSWLAGTNLGTFPDLQKKSNDSILEQLDLDDPVIRACVRHYVDGVSHMDIAEEEGISLNTAGTRSFRGKGKIKKLVEMRNADEKQYLETA